MALPGRYAMSADVRSALKAVTGVVDVQEV